MDFDDADRPFGPDRGAEVHGSQEPCRIGAITPLQTHSVCGTRRNAGEQRRRRLTAAARQGRGAETKKGSAPELAEGGAPSHYCNVCPVPLAPSAYGQVINLSLLLQPPARRSHMVGIDLLSKIKRFLKRRRYYLFERISDRRLGIRTFVKPSSLRNATAEQVHYEALNYRAIDIISTRLHLREDEVLCDIGSGLGRVVCTFAQRSLKLCVGVEFDPVLADLARANVKSMKRPRTPAVIYTTDVRNFDFAGVTTSVMYNPFGEKTLTAMLRALTSSILNSPRRVQIVYANPIHESAFAPFSLFHERERFIVPYFSGEMPVIIWEAGLQTD